MIFYKFSETDLPQVCCVYLIYNNATDRYYVGSTVNLRERMRSHRNALRNNKHSSEKLQRSFTKHGEENFSVCVAVISQEHCVRSVESIWLRAKSLTYNASLQIGGNGKENRPIFWYSQSDSRRFESTKDASFAMYGTSEKHNMICHAAHRVSRVQDGYLSFNESSYLDLHQKRKELRGPRKRNKLKNPKKVFAFQQGSGCKSWCD